MTKIVGKQTNYKQGDLVRIINVGDWTLCYSKYGSGSQRLKSMPTRDFEIRSHPKFQHNYVSIEGKCGLIVYVRCNKLNQITGYRVLLEGKEMFCKAKVAHNHFELVETKADESGGSSKI